MLMSSWICISYVRRPGKRLETFAYVEIPRPSVSVLLQWQPECSGCCKWWSSRLPTPLDFNLETTDSSKTDAHQQRGWHTFHHPSTPSHDFRLDWLNTSKTVVSKKNTVRYTDDSQLIAFTEVRFQQLEMECRWLELSWHEQMIQRFKQTPASKDQNPLQLYRELMSLITGLQTSTPIVVENRNWMMRLSLFHSFSSDVLIKKWVFLDFVLFSNSIACRTLGKSYLLSTLVTTCIERRTISNSVDLTLLPSHFTSLNF